MKNPRLLEWVIAGIVAILTHGVVLAFLNAEADSGAQAPGVGGVNISLSMVAARSGETASEEREPEAPETIATEPPDAEAPQSSEQIEADPQPVAEELPALETPIPQPPAVREPIVREEPTEAPVASAQMEPESAAGRTEPAALAEMATLPQVTIAPAPRKKSLDKPPVPRPQQKPPPPAISDPPPSPPPVKTPAQEHQPSETVVLGKQVAARPAKRHPVRVGDRIQEESRASNEGAGGSTAETETAATDGASMAGGGPVGKPSNDYMSRLRYWLERHKKYPKEARRRRMQGTVHLYFRVTRDGRVLKHDIRKSGRYEFLDREAEEMLKRAQPLPKFSDDMTGGYLDVVVPVVFGLRGNR